MDATIQMRQRGTLTLPAELRDRYNIEPDDFVLRVRDLLSGLTRELMQRKTATLGTGSSSQPRVAVSASTDYAARFTQHVSRIITHYVITPTDTPHPPHPHRHRRTGRPADRR